MADLQTFTLPAGMSTGLYAPSGNGCVGASIVAQGGAGTHAAVAPQPPLSAAGTAVLINSTNQHLYLATELAAKVERLEREMKAHKAHKTNPLQMDLLEQA